MDPRTIGANLQALHANETARHKPMTAEEEDAYYLRHAPSKGRALGLIAVARSLWWRLASAAARSGLRDAGTLRTRHL